MAVDYEIQRTEIDGVPVFWTPVEGPRMASLQFRIGRADEGAHQAGISHLVEHLALSPLKQQPYEHNGFVDAQRTVFHASGTDAQLVEFIHAVVAALQALPLDRTLMERRILLQEASGRGTWSNDALRWYRYGFRGPGLLGTHEAGLDWLGPQPIQEWASSWFTAENAVLWWSGPPPDGLRLALPRGVRKPTAETPTIHGLTLPARTDTGGQGAGVGFVVERNAASRLLMDVMRFRLQQELRFERGLVYGVATDYDPSGATTAHISIGMDCRRDDASEVAARLLGTLWGLSNSGPSMDEIAREANRFADGAEHADGMRYLLGYTAHEELLGAAQWQPRAIVDAHLSTGPDDIRAVADAASGSLLLFAPPGPYDAGFHPYPKWSTYLVGGRTVRPSGWPLSERKDRLQISPEGVTWTAPEGSSTVRYEDCVAVRHWDGSPGGPLRELWGADGFRVVVHAGLWRGGAKVIDEIDRAVDPAIVACGRHGIGGLEEEPTPPGPGSATGWGVSSP